MELKSLYFVIFSIVVVALYYAFAKVKNAQKYILLVANIFLIIAISGKKPLLIILVCVASSYGLAILIEKKLEAGKKRGAQVLFWMNVAFLIGVLCYFKFFKETYVLLQNILQENGIGLSSLATPVGISYYSLSMLAYSYDVFHKKHKAERNFIDYLTFITFFPSIIQGPINLYKKVSPQLKCVHNADADKIAKGIQRSLWGYFKKMVIGDRIGILVTAILQDDKAVGFSAIWAMILYSFQIYADFSGGIDVIMGISEMLDIQLTENFKAPLVSKSVTEFWKRWHISLGEFMEKYLYYPIVLNRRVMKFSKKIPGKYLQKVFSATLASIIVFVIVGIWHGTGWNYVVYGCYQAFFVSTAILLGPVYKKLRELLKINEGALSWRLFQMIRTFLILTLGRYFIKAKDLVQTVELFKRSFLNFEFRDFHILFDESLCEYGLNFKNLILMYLGIVIMLIVDILHEKQIHIRELFMEKDIVFRFIVYLLAVFTLIILGIYGPEYSKASFIYQGF